jgi:3-oxoacyl-[acyl-carrier protein] reductase
VYGGGGVLGGAIAGAFGREGAVVHLAGRTRSKLEAAAAHIATNGGDARVAVLDALDPASVERHAKAAAAEHGRLDVAVNALGLLHVQGKPLLELSLSEYEAPIAGYTRAQFVIARAVAPHMIARKKGVILSLSTPGTVRAYQGVLGFGTACAAIEGFTRHLACASETEPSMR